MVRIVGVNIPDNKRVEIALTYIYGLGLKSAQRILEDSKVNPDIRVRDLTDQEVDRIRAAIEKGFKVEGDLRRVVSADIKRLKEINCYRGVRHKLNLPVRGQRTRTNARTKRGKRMTVGGTKSKAAQKT